MGSTYAPNLRKFPFHHISFYGYCIEKNKSHQNINIGSCNEQICNFCLIQDEKKWELKKNMSICISHVYVYHVYVYRISRVYVYRVYMYIACICISRVYVYRVYMYIACKCISRVYVIACICILSVYVHCVYEEYSRNEGTLCFTLVKKYEDFWVALISPFFVQSARQYPVLSESQRDI